MVSYQGMGWSSFKFEDKSNSSGSLFVVLHLGIFLLFLKLLILCLELLLLSVGHIFLGLIFFDLQLQHFRDLVINTKDLVYVQSARNDRKSRKERERKVQLVFQRIISRLPRSFLLGVMTSLTFCRIDGFADLTVLVSPRLVLNLTLPHH